jgi:hypothetical protein
MGPETPLGIASTSWVTLCVLTTCYCRFFPATSLRSPLSARRTRVGEPGVHARFVATKASPCADVEMSCGKTKPQAVFNSSPSPAQQRWADRPVHPLSLMVTALYPAIPPPIIRFHLSAHRCFAGNLAIFPSSSSFASPPCTRSQQAGDL